MVSTPEPTLVPKKNCNRSLFFTNEWLYIPNELATSLAPIPKARMNAIMKPTMTIHKTEASIGSMIEKDFFALAVSCYTPVRVPFYIDVLFFVIFYVS